MKSDLPYDRPLTSNHSELNIEQRYIINFIFMISTLRVIFTKITKNNR